MKYRVRDLAHAGGLFGVVEALQYSGQNWDEMRELTGLKAADRHSSTDRMVMREDNGATMLIIVPGDWVLRTEGGSLTVMDGATFDRAYEALPGPKR